MAIARGEVAPGDPLPPVRQLAADLGINWNTVARAYRALELEGPEGLVVTARGRGTLVTSALDRSALHEVEKRVREGLERAIADAKLGGLSGSALEDLIQAVFQRTYPEVS